MRGREGSWPPGGPPDLVRHPKELLERGRGGGGAVAQRGSPRATPTLDEKRQAPPHTPPIPSPRSPGCDGDPRADTLSSTPSSLRARGAWTDPGPGVLATPSAPR